MAQTLKGLQDKKRGWDLGFKVRGRRGYKW
jgi:hypothetical protein